MKFNEKLLEKRRQIYKDFSLAKNDQNKEPIILRNHQYEDLSIQPFGL